MKKTLEQYDAALKKLCDLFVKTYFTHEECGTEEYYIIWEWWNLWQDTIEVADYFFNVREMYTALKNEIPQEELFDWYDYRLNKQSVWWDDYIMDLYRFVFWDYIYTDKERAEDKDKINKAYELLKETLETSKSILDNNYN